MRVRSPGIFLFDEPLSNLDAALRVQMRIEIARLHSEIDASMIYVTHDQVEAMTLADRIVVLRDGHIEQIGTPIELYTNPANTFVGGFIGSPPMSFVRAEVTGKTDSGGLFAHFVGGNIELNRCDLEVSDKELIVGIRPEHLRPVGSEKGPISGKVLVTEKLGGENIVHVSLDASVTIKYKCSSEHAPRPGSNISLEVDAEDIYLFDGSEKALARPK